MSFSPLALSGKIGPLAYTPIAALLIIAQHSYVWLAFRLSGEPLALDAMFGFFPMRQSMELLTIDSRLVAGGFAFCLVCSLLLGVASFRRANWSGQGHWLALLAMVPTIQIGAALILALMPVRRAGIERGDDDALLDQSFGRRQALVGLAAGMSIIVAAVVLSANALGAYGLGLFVATPLLVGVTTGYAVNYRQARSPGETLGFVVAAGLLGTLALLMLALEGLMCIVLVAPLAGIVAAVGGVIGRALAMAVHHPGQPLFSLAVLPLIFVLDAAMPPAVPVMAHEDIVIAAPPSAVWRALTDGHAIAKPSGLVGLAGLAYPIASHLTGESEGALRIGTFSTGTARERVTVWQKDRVLAFRGESHAPAMEEMSPYRVVHAPHVEGYFDTLETRFELVPLAGGTTRLSVKSRHVLRIEPVAYWGPIAAWAIRQNVRRVLEDIRQNAEAARLRTADAE